MKTFWTYIMVVVIQPCKYSKYDEYPWIVHLKMSILWHQSLKKKKNLSAMTESWVYLPLLEIYTNAQWILSSSDLKSDSGWITGDLVKWARRDKQQVITVIINDGNQQLLSIYCMINTMKCFGICDVSMIDKTLTWEHGTILSYIIKSN